MKYEFRRIQMPRRFPGKTSHLACLLGSLFKYSYKPKTVSSHWISLHVRLLTHCKTSSSSRLFQDVSMISPTFSARWVYSKNSFSLRVCAGLHFAGSVKFYQILLTVPDAAQRFSVKSLPARRGSMQTQTRLPRTAD